MAKLGCFISKKTFCVSETVPTSVSLSVACKKYSNFCEDSRSKIKLKLKIGNVFLKFMKLLGFRNQSKLSIHIFMGWEGGGVGVKQLINKL